MFFEENWKVFFVGQILEMKNVFPAKTFTFQKIQTKKPDQRKFVASEVFKGLSINLCPGPGTFSKTAQQNRVKFFIRRDTFGLIGRTMRHPQIIEEKGNGFWELNKLPLPCSFLSGLTNDLRSLSHVMSYELFDLSTYAVDKLQGHRFPGYLFCGKPV